MTHSELIDKMSERLGLTKKETRELIHETLSEFADLLEQSEGFTIPDLGTFKTELHDPKKIYNPHYKSFMLIPPKRTVRFSPSKNLKEKLKFIRPEQ